MYLCKDEIQELKKYGINYPEKYTYENMSYVIKAMIAYCEELSSEEVNKSADADYTITDEYDVLDVYGSSYKNDSFVLNKNGKLKMIQELIYLMFDLASLPNFKGLIMGITKTTIKNLIENMRILPNNEYRCFYIKIAYLSLNNTGLCEVSFDDIIKFNDTNGYNYYCPFGEHFYCTRRNQEDVNLCSLQYTQEYEKNIYDYFKDCECFEIDLDDRKIKYSKTKEVFPCKIV